MSEQDERNTVNTYIFKLDAELEHESLKQWVKDSVSQATVIRLQTGRFLFAVSIATMGFYLTCIQIFFLRPGVTLGYYELFSLFLIIAAISVTLVRSAAISIGMALPKDMLLSTDEKLKVIHGELVTEMHEIVNRWKKYWVIGVVLFIIAILVLVALSFPSEHIFSNI